MTVWPPHPVGPADETPEQRHARHRAQHERDLATLHRRRRDRLVG